MFRWTTNSKSVCYFKQRLKEEAEKKAAEEAAKAEEEKKAEEAKVSQFAPAAFILHDKDMLLFIRQ